MKFKNPWGEGSGKFDRWFNNTWEKKNNVLSKLKLQDESTNSDFADAVWGQQLTAYYSFSGQLLGTFPGEDIAIAIDPNVYNAMNSRGVLNPQNAISPGGGSSLGPNSEFEVLAAVLYAEGSILGLLQEYTAISSVLKNRAASPPKSMTDDLGRTTNVTIFDVLQWKASGVDGYYDRNTGAINVTFQAALDRDINDIAHYDETRHRTATEAAIKSMTTSVDYSDGSYFWCAYYLKNFDNNKSYEKVKEITGKSGGNTYGSKFYKIKASSTARKPW